MRGRLIFVAGAAVGYVIGSRAGHERYEQIAAGASKVWNTRAVQKGVDAAGDAALALVPKVFTVAFHVTVWLVKKAFGISTKPKQVVRYDGPADVPR